MPLLTAKELYETEGIPVGTLYGLVRAKLIPSYRTGVKQRGIRFDRAEVLAALRRPRADDLTQQAVGHDR